MTAIVAHPGGGGAPRNSIVARLVGFVRLLRDHAFPVGITEAVDAARVARSIDLVAPGDLRRSLRMLLCSCRNDWQRFDELFDAYWLGVGRKRAVRASGEVGPSAVRRLLAGGAPPGPSATPDRVEGDDASAGGRGEGGAQAASAAEVLAATDLRHINDPTELARIHDLTERLAARMRYRLTRRARARARGRRLDLRNSIHRSLRYGGVPMRLAFRVRRPQPLRLVVILDASGSMSLYSAFFVRFIRCVIDDFRQADAFVFHTRLVHIGPALRERNVERALDKLSLLSAGWSGGTKIGECLATFNRNYAAGVLNRRTVAMIVSDGYDTGAPALLAEQLRPIRRRARRVIWLNPMIGWTGFEPVAEGMKAALPLVDLFAPAHNLDSLAALEEYLARL
ncbi:MAG: vWA domain-containing protein [Pseudomonadota bacterium]